MTLESMTHDELASDLAAHLRGSADVITFENMQMGPSGSQRPDVLTILKTYGRLDVRVYEVKVSRSDFRADVTAGKWAGYLEFASSVTFACEQGLVDPKELPPRCGLILRGKSGAWRHVKRPTHQPLDNLPWTAWMKLFLDGIDRANGEHKRQHFNEWQGRRLLSKKFGGEVGEMIADLQGLPQRLENEKLRHDIELKSLREHQVKARDEGRAELAMVRQQIDPDMQELCVLLGSEPRHLRYSIAELVDLIKTSDCLKRVQKDIDRDIKSLTKASAQLAGFRGKTASTKENSCPLQSDH